MNGDCLGFLNQIFDIVVSFQVIEHMPNLNSCLLELKRVIKPGGLILISTPNVRKQESKNPFHLNEMDYNQMMSLLPNHFARFKIVGIQYAKKNRLRKRVQILPFYRMGVYSKRKSFVKRVANRALNLTNFTITEVNCEKALDLLAICYN